MRSDFGIIDENYKRICSEAMEAMAKYRKPDEKLSVMAVTKTVSAEAVNHAIGLGIDLLGENRVQEYLSKRDEYDSGARVHFIGHLQTNKIKYIIDSVDVIQSVDSFRLASEIDRYAARLGKVQDILIEVNIGGEESKSGISEGGAEELVKMAAELGNVRVRGLMAIPPPDNSERFLGAMQELYMNIADKKIENTDMEVLSMGMSSDFVDAIRFGSNLIRIGRGLFGPRN